MLGTSSCTVFMASALIASKYVGKVTGRGSTPFFRGELVFTLCKNLALVIVDPI